MQQIATASRTIHPQSYAGGLAPTCRQLQVASLISGGMHLVTLRAVLESPAFRGNPFEVAFFAATTLDSF